MMHEIKDIEDDRGTHGQHPIGRAKVVAACRSTDIDLLEQFRSDRQLVANVFQNSWQHCQRKDDPWSSRRDTPTYSWSILLFFARALASSCVSAASDFQNVFADALHITHC
jgi:hypothetical protein